MTSPARPVPEQEGHSSDPPPPSFRTRRLDLRPPGLALLIAALLLHVAWRTTGLRTLALVRLGLVATVGVNLVWAMVVAEWCRLRVVANGTDAVAGDAVELQVELRGPRQPVTIAALTAPGEPWVLAEAPVRGVLRPHLPRRGIVDDVVLAVGCHHPFGLVGWVRLRRVPLSRARWP